MPKNKDSKLREQSSGDFIRKKDVFKGILENHSKNENEKQT